MASNDSGQDSTGAPGRDGVPQQPQIPGVPGIIDGLLAMQLEPGGSVSFRLIIGLGDECAAKRDLLEMIISPEHTARLCRTLAAHNAGICGGSELVPLIPCHIGFRRNAVSAAA